jgi:hypothetical protein
MNPAPRATSRLFKELVIILQSILLANKLDLPSRGRRRTVSCKSGDLSVSTSAEGLTGNLGNTRLVSETSEVVDTLNGLPDLMELN